MRQKSTVKYAPETEQRSTFPHPCSLVGVSCVLSLLGSCYDLEHEEMELGGSHALRQGLVA